jgi:signal transduction histidine kinase
MVQMALEQKGFEVVQADNGAVGVKVAQEELPDLILCDVNMAQMDGYSTLSSLRNQVSTAAIPFILMTGLADNAGMRHGMELGADDYLPKPFTLDGLYAAVDARLKKVQTVRNEAERKLADLRDNISMMLPHELRTPLNGILAYGQLLTSECESLAPPEIAEMGGVIYESAKRLEHLVENCLIYAQIELLATDAQKLQFLGNVPRINVRKVVREKAEEQARRVNRSHDLVIQLSDCAVAISENYLIKIVNELIQNAFKFSSPGTPVRVTLSDLPGLVILTISDQGRGFSTEHISRVGAYMQFDRRMQEQQGLGLGLAIAKRLIEIHGGALTIQSGKGSGSSVTVKLPKAA